MKSAEIVEKMKVFVCNSCRFSMKIETLGGHFLSTIASWGLPGMFWVAWVPSLKGFFFGAFLVPGAPWGPFLGPEDPFGAPKPQKSRKNFRFVSVCYMATHHLPGGAVRTDVQDMGTK